MKTVVLAGISILAVVLLVFGSYANVVGYQIVKTSQLQQARSQRTLIIKSFMHLVETTTFLKGQNASFLHFVYFMIGVMFGLITLLPVAIYYCYATVLLMVVFVELYYGEVTPTILLTLIGTGIVLWLVFLLDYLLYCGFLFQEKLIHFFEGTTVSRMIGTKTY